MKNSRLYLVLLLLFLGFNSHILYCQNKNDTIIKKLADYNIYEYSSEIQLYDTVFREEWLSVSSLLSEDINNDFSNIDDLEWLKNIVPHNKVFMFGETHYSRYIHNLKTRMFFALNTYDYYPIIIMEDAYSKTPFINYYLNIKEEPEAEKYFKKILSDLVNNEELLNFINHIRRWNLTHPSKPLYVGYTDIEHNYKSTLNNIIIPYFKELDTTSLKELNLLAQDGLTLILIDKLDSLFEIAANKQFIGQYPFITSSYIGNVIENLKSLYKTKNYDFNYYRQNSIIRNLTDTAFFGKYLIDNKVMVYGGSYHTRTHFKYPDKGNFLSEGSYLNYDFEPTKGKTFSLSVSALSYSLDEMKNRPLDLCAFMGSEYRRLIKRFQKAYNENLIIPEDYYVMYGIPNEFEKLIAKKAMAYSNNPVMLEKIEWKKILNSSKLISKELYKEVLSTKNAYSDFDKIIIVPQSPVIRARLKN